MPAESDHPSPTIHNRYQAATDQNTINTLDVSAAILDLCRHCRLSMMLTLLVGPLL